MLEKLQKVKRDSVQTESEVLEKLRKVKRDADVLFFVRQKKDNNGGNRLRDFLYRDTIGEQPLN